MKLRTWLFLALFFSSFSVLAVTRAEAQASCDWFLRDFPNSGFSCGKHPDNDSICVMFDSGPSQYCWAYTTPACVPPDPLPSNAISGCPLVCAPGYAAFLYSDGHTGITCFGATPDNCSAAGMVSWTNPANGAEYCVYACDSPKIRNGDMPPACVDPPADCKFPLMNDPAHPENCIPYPDCPAGQARDPITHECGPCKPPLVLNGKRCEKPDCPPPGAWNYSTNKCEGGPPPSECNPPKHLDQYGNCIDDENPPPPPPPPPPPGTPGHDGHGSGTSTNSDGSTSKFDFDIDLSGLEKNTADSAKEAKRGADALDGIGESLKAPTHGLGGLDVPGKEFSGRTYTELLSGFTTKLQSAPLVNSVNQFFNVSSPGGSCPVWSVNAWVFEIVIDQQCSPAMQNVWPIIHGVMVLIFSVLAFRTAFL